MNILVTGGAVYANLDAVKQITNKFKGGLMVKLAEELQSHQNTKVTYMTSRGNKISELDNFIESKDIHDYMNQVLQIAPEMDVIVLGAAVANLIPLNPIKGKFPSHNYKPGDVIPIDFTIAPRIIDEVKKIAPKTHLFGFKLLSGVSHEELITAAYGILLESKATAIFANDAKDLNTVYMVTKERAVHKMERSQIAKEIITFANDKYYRTEINPLAHDCYYSAELEYLIEVYKNEFLTTPEGYIFGTVATRAEYGGFWTTARGKKELDDQVFVKDVDHQNLVVHANGKATLNAPLLDTLFKLNPDVVSILHTHTENPMWTTLEYAPSGTVRDSNRMTVCSFNIKNHGSFRLITTRLIND